MQEKDHGQKSILWHTLIAAPRWSIWLGYQTLTLMGRVQSPGAELFHFLSKEQPEMLKRLKYGCN